ncbi:MAG TPA: hypothetical protein VE091_16070 [Gemmatimonadales bacterium]|nr:hypothetical protein [Gemmatimonadales bacterium]
MTVLRRMGEEYALLIALALALALFGGAPGPSAPEIVLTAAVRDSMSAIFRTFNQHWNELGDLNTLERMLGTVRPTQREYLGCLQGRIHDGSVRIDGWVPARDMKQLQLAVTGDCDGVPRLVGTWHTHPYHADLRNRPIKERSLSVQDLATFRQSRQDVMLILWDVDSVDAALRRADGTVGHPAALRIE